MKCEECIKQGLESKMYSQGTITTCMGIEDYYDEKGMRHFHDPNAHSENYICSRGHHVGKLWYSRCPAENCTFNNPEPQLESK